MVDGTLRTIAATLAEAISRSGAPNKTEIGTPVSYTSAGCLDWLGNPLPCSCPGAYSSGYSQVVPLTTSVYLDTNANPPASTTQVVYETVGPAAVVPGDDTCGQVCLIGASEVQLFYWPVTTAAGNLSAPAAAAASPYTLVSDGFTYTSPSVYVAYRGLKASAAYQPFGLPIGGKSHDVTVGYPPEALSTSHCNMQYSNTAQAYQAINYTMLEYPPPNSALTDCAHVSGVQDVGASYYNPSASNEATSPVFSIPGPMNWVDPLWSTCIPVTYGVFDPPRKLEKASNMVAPTAAAATTAPADLAVPAAAVTPTTPPVTAGPTAGPAVMVPQSSLIQEPVASVPTVASDPSATAVPNPLPADPSLANTAPANPAPANAVAPAVSNAPIVGANDPGTSAQNSGLSLAPVVETPNYNSVVMATPSPEAVANTPAVNQPVAEAPVANPPVVNGVNAPAGNTPVANAPAANQPVANTPGFNQPVVNPPAVNPPAANTPAVNQPVANAPVVNGVNAPAGNTPVANAPTANQPVANAPITNAPVANLPTTNVPVANAPVANDPAANAPAGNVPAVNAPTVNAPVANAPAGNVPAANAAPIPAAPVVVAGPKPVVIAGNTAAPAANGGVVIASSTYAPGSKATVGGNVVSVGTNNIVQDGTTHNVPTATEPAPVLLGGNSIQAASGGGVVIASSTYKPGAQAQVAGTLVSVGPSNVIVDSSTHAIPTIAPAAAAAPTPTPVLVGGNSIANAPGGGVVIASSTYQPGVQAQVSGTRISVGTDNIVVDSSTLALPTPPSATPVLVGGQSIAKAANGGVVIASSTFAPGVTAQIAGTPISVGTDNVVVNSDSYALPSAPVQNAAHNAAQAPAAAPSPTPVLVGNQSIVKATGGGVVIGSSSVAPGAQATVQGHVVTAGTNNVVIDGNNYALPSTAGETLQQQAPAQQQQQQQIPAQVGGQSIARASNGGVVVGTSTLAPGDQATIAGTPVSAGPTNVALGSKTYALPSTAGALLQTPGPQSQQQPAPIEVAGNSIARASNGGIVIGSSTIAPGSQATISGQVISAGSTNVAVGGSTYILPTSVGAVLQAPSIPSPTSNAPVLVAGQTIARASNGGLIVGSSTIAPGAEATIAGHVVSAASPGGTNIAIDGSNYAIATKPGAVLATPAPNLPPVSPQHEAAVLTLSNGAVISAGGSAAVINGVTASVLSDDSGVVVGTKTIPLPPLSALAATPNPVYTVADQTFTARPTGFAIDGTSMLPGGAPITVSGTVVSLGKGALQIGSTIMPLPTAPSEVFTVGDQTFNATPTGFSIAETSISQGGSAVTISGTVVSLGSAGLQIGSSTVPLDAAEFTAAAGGIVSGIGLSSPTGGAMGYGNSTASGSNSTSFSPPAPSAGSSSAPPLPSSMVTTGKAGRIGGVDWMLVLTGVIAWGVGLVAFTL